MIQIAGLIHHELRLSIEKHNLNLKKAMKILKGLRLSKEKTTWQIKNAVKEKREMAELIGISLDPSEIV